MGYSNTSVKALIFRLKDLMKNCEMIEAKLSVPGLSPGRHQCLLKEKTLQYGKVKSLLKRIESLTQGNIVSINFRDIETQDRFRIVYTNISVSDAQLHLKLVAEIQHRKIEILEAKEVKTQNSLTKL